MARDAPLKRDGSGAAALGLTNASLDVLYAAHGDPDAGSVHATMWRWDTDSLEWVRFDGRMDTVVSGDLIIAVDDLEDLIRDQQNDYKVSDFDISSDPVYLGQLKKDGSWIIKQFNLTNGTVRYLSGSSGYSTAWTNRASGSYDYFDTEF